MVSEIAQSLECGLRTWNKGGSGMSSGVLKITAEDRSYYMASDIMTLLGISKSKAYDVIRTMRKECIDAGKLTSIPSRAHSQVFR